ncbi:LysR family transcriptional regulator [Avibacterium sp. 20-15]|uniref:LysR family transcriptional regulator n=1 Tax=unclassified Avibacterium TaxID=2685287 RepID=UPI002025F69B|nr:MULTISPECIES: LysR family transcriptional regulator [unclassified Avibacterium]MCW9733008.1 LysR family transcriptional regulator [Avibacterium sp. 20-15]URL05138.1 LysR family transcriptional regulator [Avibacterium sp. 20-132]
MDLNALRLFVAAVQCGSLSKASQQLDIPLATLSRQIVKLEAALQVQLFNRFKAGVKPTEAGLRLYEQVHLPMDNLLNAQEALFHEQNELAGRLRLSAIPTCTPLLAWVDEFCQRYPKVQVHCQLTERVLDLAADGIDIAFRVGNLQADHLIAKPILQSRAKLVAHPSLLAKWGVPQDPQALSRLPCAGWGRGDAMMTWQLGDERLNLNYRFASNDSYALVFAAKAGMAICQLPDFLADDLIQKEGLVEVLVDYPQPAHELYMLYAAHRYPSRTIKTFIDFVKHKSPLYKQKAAY